MCGSRPGARRGDGVDRDQRVGRQAVLLAVGGDALLDRREQIGIGRAEVRARAGRAVVAGAGRRRAGVEVLRSGERLADQLAADDDAVALDQRAVGLVAERDLADRRARAAGRRRRR